MSVNGKVRSSFGDKLRVELDRQGISIRKLSRQLDDKRPEIARRNLSRWIAGTRPTKGSRVLVAHALGLEPNFFDEDDEDDDPEMGMLVSALLHRIDRVVEEQLEVRIAQAVALPRDGEAR